MLDRAAHSPALLDRQVDLVVLRVELLVPLFLAAAFRNRLVRIGRRGVGTEKSARALRRSGS